MVQGFLDILQAGLLVDLINKNNNRYPVGVSERSAPSSPPLTPGQDATDGSLGLNVTGQGRHVVDVLESLNWAVRWPIGMIGNSNARHDPPVTDDLHIPFLELPVTTVLAVDDDADHRELYPLTLRRYGYRVLTAADTSIARLALSAGGIDAVLLDVQLPVESGIELCRHLRLAPATARLPIMLVSADVSEKRIDAGLAAGANDYLTKPFVRAELAARLRTLLRTANLTAARAALLAAPAARPALTRRAAPGRLTRAIA